MAHFAKSTIHSKTSDRLQRHADALPYVSGTVRQTGPGVFVFDGHGRGGMIKCVGHKLGTGGFQSARAALDALNTPRNTKKGGG